MKYFLKKYIRPFLKVFNIYSFSYRLFFKIISIVNNLLNILYRLCFKTAPILLYHRVALLSNDPQLLGVPPENFEEHLIFLKKYYNVISLSELSIRLKNKTLVGNETAITFDDGYVDNLRNALPLLEKHNIPATIFVTTGSLGKVSSFEWDAEYSDNDKAFFISEEQLKKIADHPLIEIGAHTNTHMRLANFNPEQQRKDILDSKNTLERITGKKIRLFAYPFGGIYDFNKQTEKVVKELGFDFAFSNTQRLATMACDDYRIPRMNIRKCSVTELSKIIYTYK